MLSSRGSSWPRDQTQGSNLGLLYCRQILYHLSHQALRFRAHPKSSMTSSQIITSNFQKLRNNFWKLHLISKKWSHLEVWGGYRFFFWREGTHRTHYIGLTSKNIYLFGCTGSYLRYTRSSIFVAACLISNCGRWDLVPWPGIASGPPVLGMMKS